MPRPRHGAVYRIRPVGDTPFVCTLVRFVPKEVVLPENEWDAFGGPHDISPSPRERAILRIVTDAPGPVAYVWLTDRDYACLGAVSRGNENDENVEPPQQGAD